MRRLFSQVTAGIFSIMAVMAPVDDARAQACSVSITPLAFGTYVPPANTATDSMATVAVSCTGIANQTVRMCLDFGTTAGSSGTRTMQSGGNTLLFNVFQDASRQVPWDDSSGTTTVLTIPLDSATGAGETKQTVYGRIFAGQQSVYVGSYAAALTVVASYDYQGSGGVCGTNAVFAASAAKAQASKSVTKVVTGSTKR